MLPARAAAHFVNRLERWLLCIVALRIVSIAVRIGGRSWSWSLYRDRHGFPRALPIELGLGILDGLMLWLLTRISIGNVGVLWRIVVVGGAGGAWLDVVINGTLEVVSAVWLGGMVFGCGFRG